MSGGTVRKFMMSGENLEGVLDLGKGFPSLYYLSPAHGTIVKPGNKDTHLIRG